MALRFFRVAHRMPLAQHGKGSAWFKPPGWRLGGLRFSRACAYRFTFATAKELYGRYTFEDLRNHRAAVVFPYAMFSYGLLELYFQALQPTLFGHSEVGRGVLEVRCLPVAQCSCCSMLPSLFQEYAMTYRDYCSY